MSTIKVIALLLCIIPGCLTAQQKGFTIQGSAPKTYDGKIIYLDYTNNEGTAIADSAEIKKGKFSFQGKVSEPNYARMIFDNEAKGKFAVQNTGDRLFFYIGNENYKMAIQDSLHTAKVSGSPLYEAYTQYLNYIGGDFMDIIAQANNAFSAVDPKSPDANEQYAAVRKKFDQKFDDRNDRQVEFAKANTSSIFSIAGLTEVSNKRGVKDLEPIFLNLSGEIRQTEQGRAMEALILASKMIKVGQDAPDFAQPDANGNMISLSDFRGQFILVDFWASWCGPCREENPNLRKAYDNYKSKGLEVLAVSIDDTKGRDAWLQAIIDDDLPWIHVADLKGWRNDAATLYGVRGVPQNYLIDPQGKIVALNLRGEELHTVLEEILGKR